jgi:membrane associated rhomboid family serine protease
MIRHMPPVTLALIVANVAIYFLQVLFGTALIDLLALTPPGAGSFPGDAEFEAWQLVTYAFLHGNPAHLFFNMFALYMFGPSIERLLGSRRFAFYYFACVVGAAVTQLLTNVWLDREPSQMLGASGGVFGVLLAFGMAYPRQRIMLLFPPIPMPAWIFVTLYGLFELVLGVTGTAEGVAHFAHLGGMAAGIVLMLMWRRR